MQKRYRQKHCLQCRVVTFHFRQMLLGLPGMWQNIWLMVLQVLLCSPWKINTLSFHYRQAIRHRTIQMKSKSNLERKLQNICLSFYLRKFHYHCAQQQHDWPWNSASGVGVCTARLKSRRGFRDEPENMFTGCWTFVKVGCSVHSPSSPQVHILPYIVGSSSLSHLPWAFWRGFLPSLFIWAFPMQKQNTESGGSGRLCTPPCKFRSQPRLLLKIKS